MKTSELRAMTSEQLQIQLVRLLKQRLQLSFQNSQQEMKQNHLWRTLRRDIARIMTIKREQEAVAHA